MIQSLSDALAERGYDKLTDVQEAVTNPELADADLLVSAQTGSGKTVAFGMAIAPTLMGEDETLDRASSPLALVIAPTRELAFQVMRELQWLYAKAGARVVSCVGGMDAREERRALERGAHIVVGTPGRLVDHIKRGNLDMKSLRAVVLDEADEMLDLGFREDLEFMLGEAPEERRTLMFSATVPTMIAKLAKKFQRDAVRVQTVSKGDQHADISYQALKVAQHDAENAIINVLRYHDAQNAIVFGNTRAMVNRLTARLSNRGFSVVSLSGELSQTERTHALQAMRDGRARVCVATDVAARGIDLPGLDLVIHAELPSNAEGLLHRSGRTGRAGRKGISALIVPARQVNKADRLLRFAKIQAEWTVPPSADDILRKDEERLLNDPVWEAEVSDAQNEFAAKLLELHGAEKIAAAYLTLYRSRQSAPEELSAPDARPERGERKPFGASAWFALSVGRDDRAEPRWLLPLLCRAGNIDKSAIGAIRMQQSETFIELKQANVDGFVKAIGGAMVLEDGVKIRKLDKAPDVGERPRRDGPPRGDKPRGDKPRYDKPRGDKPRGDKPQYDKPRGDKPQYDKPKRDYDAPKKPRAPKAPSKSEQAVADGSIAAYKAPKPAGGNGERPGKPAYGKKPEGKFGGKPAGKPGGKPGGKKPFRKDSAAPTGDAPRKPRGASGSDPSKRFTPPGGAGKPRKPAGKRGAGGTTSPKRKS